MNKKETPQYAGQNEILDILDEYLSSGVEQDRENNSERYKELFSPAIKHMDIEDIQNAFDRCYIDAKNKQFSIVLSFPLKLNSQSSLEA